MKKIAITIQNFVQFYSVKPFIDSMTNVCIDLFVPEAINDLGFKEMFDDIYNYLVSAGYNVYRKVDMSKKYKILLEPYPMDIYFIFNYEYRIKYKYSVISAKPNLIYKAESNIFYDAILCHSTYEKEVLSNFSSTYLVGKLNYFDFEKQDVKSDKKTLLYLPTYGNLNSINDVVAQLKKLKSKYNIITKQHHGTNYLNSENEKNKKLFKYIDKVYDSSTSLSKLLETCDVVLSDNSGSIFEALYCNVPVCIFSKNMESCSLDNIKSLQLTLVEKGVIPFTDDVSKLDKVIEQALSKKIVLSQRNVNNQLFPINASNILSSFVDVINMFLNDEIEKDKILLHRKIVDDYNFLNKQVQMFIEDNQKLNNSNLLLKENNNNLINQNYFLKEQLDDYKKGKLYRIATKIYSFKSKLRRKKYEK